MTPEQWRDQLEAMLEDRRPRLEMYDRYYRGEHRLAFATSKFREAFGELFEAFSTNWCGLVVDVCAERLVVQGFEFGEDEANDEAWLQWQDSSLDAGALSLHTTSIKAETAYLIVGPPRVPDDENSQPTVTVESPHQVIVVTDPADRTRRVAALKKFVAIDGSIITTLWLPDKTYMWAKDTLADRVESLGIFIPAGVGGDYQLIGVEDNAIAPIIPVIPFDNAPDLLTGGTSDLKPAIALNDAANKFFTDMLVASEYNGFPQRVLTGVDLESAKNPDGSLKSEAEIRAAVSRVWAFEDPNAKAFQLNAGQLSQYVEGVDMAVQHLAAQTRTPPHYLLAKLINVSGDALVAAETGLEHRAKRKHLDFSDAHEEAQRVGFAWRAAVRPNDGRASRWQELARFAEAETVWGPTANRDPVSLAQSLTMKQAIGVPKKVLWREAGYTPQQIKDMEEELAAEQKAEADAAAAQREHELKMAQATKPAPADPNAPKPKPEPVPA
jgi:hypothetical protein